MFALSDSKYIFNLKRVSVSLCLCAVHAEENKKERGNVFLQFLFLGKVEFWISLVRMQNDLFCGSFLRYFRIFVANSDISEFDDGCIAGKCAINIA